MSLNDYDGLKTEIASYLARSDVTSASDSVDTFIDLAEAHFNKKLRVLRMMEDVSLATAAAQTYTNLPTDFIKFFAVEYTDSPKKLEYLPAQSNARMYAGTEQGKPDGFYLGWSGTLPQMKYIKTPDAIYDITGVYYQKIPALSSGNTTNWLLTDYPELYLNACLYYAFKRFRSPIAADYKALTDNDIKILNDEAEEIQTAGGGMQMRVYGTTP